MAAQWPPFVGYEMDRQEADQARDLEASQATTVNRSVWTRGTL
jgi:hypothetical protein